MTEREVNISELLAAGKEGRQLLVLAQVARATFFTDELDGQQFVRCGNNVKLHGPTGKDVVLAASGPDLTSALKALFRTASLGSPLIESKPIDSPSNLRVMFRYKEETFKI